MEWFIAVYLLTLNSFFHDLLSYKNHESLNSFRYNVSMNDAIVGEEVADKIEEVEQKTTVRQF